MGMHTRLLASFIVSLAGTSAAAAPVTAVLRLQEKVAIEEFAKDVNNPSSPRYHKFYTPEELRAYAAPSEGEYNAVLQTLAQQGFQVVHESATHLWVSVKADSTLFEKVFSTPLQKQSDGSRKQMVKAQIPANLSFVAGIVGLDNSRKRVPRIRFNGVLDDANKNTGVPQATIKTAYGFDPIYSSGITGRNQHIAIATYMGFNISDVQDFYRLSNLSPGPAVDQVQFNGAPAVDDNSAVETELDAEFTGMMAPGASIHVFASATNDDAGEAQMFTAILDDNRAHVVNYSWGGCESGLASAHKDEMDKIFQRAVAQGVNVMVASGDSGTDGCRDGSVSADWPGTDPSIVAVGGTTFTYNNNKMSEVGWADSGGGVSVIFPLPDWQKGIGSQFTMRSFPDVAFNADPKSGEAIYARQSSGSQPSWLVIGGTSMAAPQWSGFMALVAEAREQKGLEPLGFLPPMIYNASNNQRASIMNDITSGNNGYDAGPGWDAVTGYGSMQASNLLNYLVKQ
jgi:kumamolisin